MRALLLVALVGCGGGKSEIDASTTDGPPRDASIDAPPDAVTAVRLVVCPVTVAATITTSNFTFVPATLPIKVDEIVELAPESVHRIVPHASLPTDPALRSGPVGEVRCVQFTMVGTYNYQCAPHPTMEGVVTVTD